MHAIALLGRLSSLATIPHFAPRSREKERSNIQFTMALMCRAAGTFGWPLGSSGPSSRDYSSRWAFHRQSQLVCTPVVVRSRVPVVLS